MRRTAWLAAVVALSSGCGDKTRGAKHIPRDRDGAAVVVVQQAEDGIQTLPEVEPNGDAATATAVEFPGGATGSLDGSTDVDYYRVLVPSDATLFAKVGGIDAVDFVLELADSTGKVVASCDNGPGKVSEGFPNVPVAAGSYLLVVREFRSKRRKAAPREGPSPSYRLTVRPGPASSGELEVEPNDSLQEAGELAQSSAKDGYVGWAKDVDYWKLVVDPSGGGQAVDVDVSGVPGVQLRAAIVDSAGVVVLSRAAEPRGQGVAIRGWLPAGDASNSYFLKLSGRRSSFEMGYQARVVVRPLAGDSEWEPNDDPKMAIPLATEESEGLGARTGHLTPGDVDYFAVPVSEGPSVLDLTLTPAASRDVELAVVSSSGVEIAAADNGRKGAAEELSTVAVQGHDRLFVRVRERQGSGKQEDEAAGSYTLGWALRPGGGPTLAPVDTD